MSGILQTLFLGAAAAVKDAYFNLVTLLLNTTATNGAQNNTFLDSSSNNFTITRNGNTTQGTFTPFSQTGWSNYFGSSTSDRLTFTSNASYAVGTGNFTAECFVNFSSNTKTNQWMFNYGASGQSTLFITLQSNVLSIPIGNSTVITYSFTPVVGTWYHIAVVRSGTGTNQVALYINGVSVATGTSSASLGQYAFGVGGIDWAADYNVNGYLSNVRYSNTARYSSNFTPATTPFTSDANTLLLTCQNNRFIDNSSLANTYTLGGTPSVQAFSPFAPTTAYDTAVVGGSGYFDGSGDYLVTPSNAAVSSTLLASDFTIECWLYLTTYPGGGAPIWTNSTSNSDGFSSSYVTSSGTVAIGKVGVNEVVSTATVVRNAWNHFATVRSGATVYLYLNGAQIASGAASTYLNTSSAKPLQIAQSNQSSPANLTGYISGYRAVSSALYTGSTYTIPTSVPTAISGTTLLLNFTNAGIYDSAAKNDLETVGNAQVSTTQAKWGGSSISFPGTSGSYLKPSTSDLGAFGTGDFTIEMWVYFNSVSGTQNLIDFRSATADVAPTIALSSSALIFYVTGSTRITTSTLSATTWYYIACVRSSGVTKMYINGTQSGSSYTDTNSYVGKANRPWIGELADGTTPAQPLNGYIDDLRITKGYARTITTPTSAFPLQ